MEEKENENEKECRLDDQVWHTARILSVAKYLSLETLNETGDLLFGYLVDGLDLDTTAVGITMEMEMKRQQRHVQYFSVIQKIMDEIDQAAGSQEGL
jgi:hypothetical protein